MVRRACNHGVFYKKQQRRLGKRMVTLELQWGAITICPSLITNQSLDEKWWSDSTSIMHTDARRPPKSRNLPLTQQIGDVVLLITEEIALTHAAIIPGARLTRQVTRAGEH